MRTETQNVMYFNFTPLRSFFTVDYVYVNAFKFNMYNG